VALTEHRDVQSASPRRLAISENGRYFVDGEGRPFLYLADTAWTLFKRLTLTEVDHYFSNRVAKGFTVIQAYVLRGLEVPNLEGELPLIDHDPTRLNEAFFRNIDDIVDRAGRFGLTMGLVATMGAHVLHVEGRAERYSKSEAIFDKENAFTFGELLGARYKDQDVIWYLGGDHNPSADTIGIWDAMATGLKTGSAGQSLVSYHVTGGASSSTLLHERKWLDFNAPQSGHRAAEPTYEYISHDYALVPVKPSIDMEARYEDVPDGLWYPRIVSNPSGRIDARQVREAAYWGLLAGAAGFGYGHNSVWCMYDGIEQDPRDYSFPMCLPRAHWLAALDSPGAFAMGYMRRLLELRPWYRLVPDQTLIVAGQGEGEDHVQAACAEDGSFALAYLPFGHVVVAKTSRITGSYVKAQWFNPRDGSFTQIGRYAKRDMREFVPPSMGDDDDWVLVLEDASKDLPID
jgi:hypothetical protein